MISTVALVSDLYSLSVEARAAVVSFFVNQEIRLLPWYTRYPLVEHWSSGQPANHYLKKRWSFKVEFLENKQTNVGRGMYIVK